MYITNEQLESGQPFEMVGTVYSNGEPQEINLITCKDLTNSNYILFTNGIEWKYSSRKRYRKSISNFLRQFSMSEDGWKEIPMENLKFNIQITPTP